MPTLYEYFTAWEHHYLATGSAGALLALATGAPLDRHGTGANDMADILALRELDEEAVLDAPFSSRSLFNC
ncbi:hypothetical protein [Streptomyces sp. NPDC088246]|uniref:hypothetical protein n=1 Tax=Streptomyces sp. NPDC088246 TaxID=3365842 RepID=UPI0038160677